MSESAAGIKIPGSGVSQAAAMFAMAAVPDILYRHRVRVFPFAALIGQRRQLAYASDLVYVTALFNDVRPTSMKVTAALQSGQCGRSAIVSLAVRRT
ncbi:hypothetical protein [Paraburkholderia strydomiana]|uniref:hypothetical protein n=1 Tax=Paraburkholderia strydomiana TaxID=1245417 RepID=UPI002855A2DC|nr:hypothetical protein [Paraburkholderia strydomiana]MDR7010057.1 hypothetical protein [Paraburkholderia strydomiana]